MHDGWFRFCGMKELFIGFCSSGFSTCAFAISSSNSNMFLVSELSLCLRGCRIMRSISRSYGMMLKF